MRSRLGAAQRPDRARLREAGRTLEIVCLTADCGQNRFEEEGRSGNGEPFFLRRAKAPYGRSEYQANRVCDYDTAASFLHRANRASTVLFAVAAAVGAFYCRIRAVIPRLGFEACFGRLARATPDLSY